MDNIQVVEVRGQRVLTTRQIADAYGTTIKKINRNFERNKARYVAGKHYITLTGGELKTRQRRRQKLAGCS